MTSVPTATEPAAPGSEATAAGPIGTGSRGTRLLGGITLLGLGLGAYLALVSSPQDENMGDVVRILYVHVPDRDHGLRRLRHHHRGQRHGPVEADDLVGRDGGHGGRAGHASSPPSRWSSA